MIPFTDALRAARRGTYVHGPAWRVLVLVRDNRHIPAVWDEAKALIGASSIRIEKALYVTRTMQLEKGGLIRFAAVGSLDDAYALAGNQFTHIIWLYQPDPRVQEYVAATLRSPTVPSSEMRTDFVDW